jgi:hypothetical protein
LRDYERIDWPGKDGAVSSTRSFAHLCLKRNTETKMRKE